MFSCIGACNYSLLNRYLIRKPPIMKTKLKHILCIVFFCLSATVFSQCSVCTLTNPAVLPSPIPAGTIVCITTDMTYAGATMLTGGEIHICSGARVTFNGSVVVSASSKITLTDCSRATINGSVFNLSASGITVLDNCDCDSAFIQTGSWFGFPIVCSPLPIELISFTAENTGTNIVNINWTTASEINNSHFIIERSLDAFSWTEIARIDGAGYSNELLNYDWIDEAPSSGTFYYRLSQVDV